MPTKRTSKASSPFQNRLRLLLALLVFILFLYFLFTGSDPFGLFQPKTTATPAGGATQVAAPPPMTAPTTPIAAPSVGGWWQVYFTQPDRNANQKELSGVIPEQLLAHIQQAQHTIHIAAFEFNLTPIAEALIAAHARGVEVRWFTDDENGIEADAEEGHGQFAMLQQAGIEVKDDARSALMHNKFWIFDQQLVWTGSTNATINDMMRNNNNVIVMENPEVAAIYEREFAELWAGQSGPTSPSTVDQQTTVIDGTPVQIYFASEDEAVAHLAPLVEKAQHRVRFMAFSFTDGALGGALLARAQAGVDVQGIFETRGSETEFSQLSPLFCADIPVRQDGNPGTFHHKVFVIDDDIVITGSLNFSANADNSNDENVIVLQQRDIATLYLAEFDRRWAEAREPDAAAMKCK
jgi:phosphatidylserine/phosphatidylglycerophosphate/cardiolipin synthase-like enzyme